MSIRSAVVSQIQQVATETNIWICPLLQMTWPCWSRELIRLQLLSAGGCTGLRPVHRIRQLFLLGSETSSGSMKTQPTCPVSLREKLGSLSDCSGRFLQDLPASRAARVWVAVFRN